MFCRTCGKEMTAGGRFCRYCGTEAGIPVTGEKGAPGAAPIPEDAGIPKAAPSYGRPEGSPAPYMGNARFRDKDGAARESWKRQIRLAPFVLVLLCFFLPFVQVSCQGRSVLALTGYQLAIGTETEQSDPITGQSQKREIPREASILLVLFCTIAAIGFCFAGGRIGRLLPAVAGVAGFALMLVAKGRFDEAVAREGQGILTVDFMSGFVGTCILLLVGAVVSFFSPLDRNAKH